MCEQPRETTSNPEQPRAAAGNPRARLGEVHLVEHARADVRDDVGEGGPRELRLDEFQDAGRDQEEIKVDCGWVSGWGEGVSSRDEGGSDAAGEAAGGAGGRARL